MNGAGALFSFDPSGKQVGPADGYLGSALSQPTQLIFDGLGGLWVLDSGQVLKFKASDGTPITGSTGFTAGGIGAPLAFALDASGAAWVADQNAGLVKLSNDGSAGTAYPIGAQYPDAIAIDEPGNLWIGDGSGRGGIVEANPAGAVLSPASQYQHGGIGEPNLIAVDGAGHIWATNTGNGGLVTLSEIDGAGNAISPATGYDPLEPIGSFQSAIVGLAIDPSGNVWLLNPNGPVSGPIQILGIAAPVLTPLAANLVAPNHPAQPAITF